TRSAEKTVAELPTPAFGRLAPPSYSPPHILMSWWIWVLAGFALLAIEMASTTMHVGFFGIGAFVEGLITGLGFGGPLWAQILTFTLISLVALFLIRPIVMQKMRLNINPIVDTLIGESAVAMDLIAPSSLGKAE